MINKYCEYCWIRAKDDDAGYVVVGLTTDVPFVRALEAIDTAVAVHQLETDNVDDRDVDDDGDEEEEDDDDGVLAPADVDRGVDDDGDEEEEEDDDDDGVIAPADVDCGVDDDDGVIAPADVDRDALTDGVVDPDTTEVTDELAAPKKIHKDAYLSQTLSHNLLFNLKLTTTEREFLDTIIAAVSNNNSSIRIKSNIIWIVQLTRQYSICRIASNHHPKWCSDHPSHNTMILIVSYEYVSILIFDNCHWIAQ